jgi:isoleucyl-tRNA synthetase
VGGNGVYLPTAPILAGEHIYKANPKIIEALGAVGRLWAHQPIKHSYHTAGVIRLRLFSVQHHNGLSAWIKRFT